MSMHSVIYEVFNGTCFCPLAVQAGRHIIQPWGFISSSLPAQWFVPAWLITGAPYASISPGIHLPWSDYHAAFLLGDALQLTNYKGVKTNKQNQSIHLWINQTIRALYFTMSHYKGVRTNRANRFVIHVFCFLISFSTMQDPFDMTLMTTCILGSRGS